MVVAAIATTTERHVTQRFYRPELDTVRFLAFFGVFACHFLFIRPTLWLSTAYRPGQQGYYRRFRPLAFLRSISFLLRRLFHYRAVVEREENIWNPRCEEILCSADPPNPAALFLLPGDRANSLE